MDRLSYTGIPSTTYWVSYSDPRGCSTALASTSQPGNVVTTSTVLRPSVVAGVSSSCRRPTRITAVGSAVSSRGAAPVTVMVVASPGTCNTTESLHRYAGTNLDDVGVVDKSLATDRDHVDSKGNPLKPGLTIGARCGRGLELRISPCQFDRGLNGQTVRVPDGDPNLTLPDLPNRGH